MAPYGSFNEEAQAVWDFVRCQRADGTFYGTRGKCRKGNEAGDKEAVAPQPRETPPEKAKSELKPVKKPEEGYTPRERGKTEKPGLLRKVRDRLLGKRENDIENIGFKDKNEINRMFDDRIQDILQNTGGGPSAERALKWNEDSRKRALKAHEENKKFAANLKKEMPKGFKAMMDTDDGVIVMEKKVGKHSVEVRYSPSSGFNYRVNGDYDTGTVKDRKEQIRIATSVREAWDSVVRASPEGQKFNTSAYDGDGKANQRIKAYKRIGFGEPNQAYQMYAVKKGGRVVPSDEQDESADYLVNFSEDSQTAAWMQVIFPSGKRKTEKSLHSETEGIIHV